MDQQVERHSHCLHFIPLKLFNSLGNLKIFSLCQKLLVETNSISIGTEKGSMESKREGLMWHMEIRNEADPFSGHPIIPTWINGTEITMETDRTTKLVGHLENRGRVFSWNITSQPDKSLKPLCLAKFATHSRAPSRT